MVPDDDEEETDEADSAATASDWRRNAADFEVPENVAADPVYSYGRNFEPITFPSEKDVPPKRVRVEDKSEDEAAIAPAASMRLREARRRRLRPRRQLLTRRLLTRPRKRKRLSRLLLSKREWKRPRLLLHAKRLPLR